MVNAVRKKFRVALSVAFWGLLVIPASSDITYSLYLDDVEKGIAERISTAMEESVAIYNLHGSFNKHLNVYYSAGVPTAQASYNGTITFGGQIGTRTALHEIGHTLGIGQHWTYGALMDNGVWQGALGRSLAIAMGSPYEDGMHGDKVHMWPWGMNYDKEDGYEARIKLVRELAAMRCDMAVKSGDASLLAFSKEAEHAVIASGADAVFSVESPVAEKYRWFKDGKALSDRGRISGSKTASLTIVRVQESDEGRYWCEVSFKEETLRGRPRRLMTERLTGQWSFDGDAEDHCGSGRGELCGSPAFVSGKVGKAIRLDGENDFVTLPAGVADGRDFTVAAWVYWYGGAAWQRVFDFGTGTSSYLCLTPCNSNEKMQFSVRNGAREVKLEAPKLATRRWTHVAVIRKGGVYSLYVDGESAASVEAEEIDPIDFSPALNYLGKSQYDTDPMFKGCIDDLRIYTYAYPVK